jgi:transcriptional regulator
VYVPEHFEQTRIDALHDLMRAYPFGTLVALTANGLDAAHIPFELDPSPAPFGILRCHVARANPLWREYAREREALAIFQGPDAYISPAWYASKREHGKVVPTWNYAIVHAHGSLRIIEDRAWLRALVETLTARHEAPRTDPWNVNDAPAKYIEQTLRAIVGIEMVITRLVGKWKLSQNRSAADRDSVVQGLRSGGDEAGAAIADLMQGMKGDQ